jgi:hypothetical protein
MARGDGPGRALGYLVVPPGAVREQAVDAAVRYFAACLAAGPYELRGVLADGPGEDRAFYALVGALRRGLADAVVVSDMTHLNVHGGLRGADLRQACRSLHARVVVGPGPHGAPEGRHAQVRGRAATGSRQG